MKIDSLAAVGIHVSPEEPAAPVDAEPEPAAVQKKWNDYKNLEKMLGSIYEVDDDALPEGFEAHMSASGQTLVGRAVVAMKWAGPNKGKWMVGVIKSQLMPSDDDDDDHDDEDAGADSDAADDDLPNFVVDYPEEGGGVDSDKAWLEPATHLRYPALYRNQDIGHWVLLKEVALGDDVMQMARDGVLHNPPTAASLGRPTEARRKPFAGPTSGGKRRKQR